MIYAGLCLQEKQVLVVGAGRAAFQKVCELFCEQAIVTVCAKNFAPAFARFPQGIYLQQAFAPCLLDGKHFVYAATNSASLNAEIAKLAKNRGLFCASLTACETASVRRMSAAQNGLLTVGVFTQGASPALSPVLAQEAADFLHKTYGERLKMLAALRSHAQKNLPSGEARTAYLRRLAKCSEQELVQECRQQGIELQ